jgi:hypothetical protein
MSLAKTAKEAGNQRQTQLDRENSPRRKEKTLRFSDEVTMSRSTVDNGRQVGSLPALGLTEPGRQREVHQAPWSQKHRAPGGLGWKDAASLAARAGDLSAAIDAPAEVNLEPNPVPLARTESSSKAAAAGPGGLKGELLMDLDSDGDNSIPPYVSGDAAGGSAAALLLRPGEVSDNFVRRNLKGRGSFLPRQKSREARKSRPPRETESELFDGGSEGGGSSSDGETGAGWSLAGEQSAGAGAGGGMQLGLDPLQLSLDALDGAVAPSDSQGKTKRPAVAGAVAADRKLKYLVGTASSSLSSAAALASGRPLFKVTRTQTLCDEVVSSSRGRRAQKASSSSSRPSLAERQQQRKDLSAAFRRRTREDAGMIDDAWLEEFAPKCSGHEMPAKLLVVKKAGPNKVGRANKTHEVLVLPLK